MKKNITIITFMAIITVIGVRNVQAINMQSNEYRIQMGTVDSGGQIATSSGTYVLNSSIGQAAAKEFQSNGYVVKAGFQYINSRVPFSFSLSSIRIDLGTLLPNSFKTGEIALKVSFGGAGQYIVTARADTPLTVIQGTNTIPFTMCNASDCTITSAKSWTNSSIQGFGYGMTGQDIPSDFTGNLYPSSIALFRPFANKLTAEDPAPIMQSSGITADVTPTPAIPFTPAPALTGTPRATTHQAIITLKANIVGVQPAGTYATVIRFLATPSF